MKRIVLAIVVAACGHDAADVPEPDGSVDPTVDAAIVVDAPPAAVRGLGMVTGVHAASCPGSPAGSTCQQLTVLGCPELETEPRDALIAIVEPTVPLAGTIIHFKGGGGEGYQTSDTAGYAAAGFRQVFVSWTDDWELTMAAGIKAAACRPATVIQWVFATSRSAARASRVARPSSATRCRTTAWPTSSTTSTSCRGRRSRGSISAVTATRRRRRRSAARP
jgi:hypothetical protein